MEFLSFADHKLLPKLKFLSTDDINNNDNNNNDNIRTMKIVLWTFITTNYICVKIKVLRAITLTKLAEHKLSPTCIS